MHLHVSLVRLLKRLWHAGGLNIKFEASANSYIVAGNSGKSGLATGDDMQVATEFLNASLPITPCLTALCLECLADMQARAQAAEEALAAANTAAEGERLALQGQVDESRTVVGQWKEAYEKLQSQYEAIQVSPYTQKGRGVLSHCLYTILCLDWYTVGPSRAYHRTTSKAQQGFDLLSAIEAILIVAGSV